jgi:hypothetical protein
MTFKMTFNIIAHEHLPTLIKAGKQYNWKRRTKNAAKDTDNFLVTVVWRP